MLTYQLQSRIYQIKNEKSFSFPNDVEIEIYLEPKEQFGVGEKHSKTAVQNRKAMMLYDANTGRSSILSDPPLEPIEAILEWDDLRLELKGNKLYVKAKCETPKSLDDLLISLHYMIPILMNVEFAEPPIVKYTRGRVGEAIFNWELEQTTHRFDITTKEKQEQRVIDSFERLEITSGLFNRRLAAALNYFYVARRLVDAGNSPYEFMSEVVLNLCKVIEILFGPKRDNVRSKLLNLGYSKDEIEVKFIPIMILRNEFDVGHVSIALFKREQLNALYTYLENSENDFRDLLKKILNKVKNGDYTLQQDPDLSLDKDKLKVINDLIRTFEMRTSQNHA